MEVPKPTTIGLVGLVKSTTSRKVRRKEERQHRKKRGRPAPRLLPASLPPSAEEKERKRARAQPPPVVSQADSDADGRTTTTKNKKRRERGQVSLATAALLGRPPTADSVAQVRTTSRRSSSGPPLRAAPASKIHVRFGPAHDPMIEKEASEIAYLERKLGLRKKGGRERLRREFQEEDGYDADFGLFLESLNGVVDGSDEEESAASRGRRPRFSSFDAIEGSDDDDDDDDDDEEEEAAFAAAVAAHEAEDRINEVPEAFDEILRDEEPAMAHYGRTSGARARSPTPIGGGVEEAGESLAMCGHAPVAQVAEGTSERDPGILREEAEIVYLEKKLGLHKKGGAKRFYEEIESEEFGEGFGTFLRELNSLSSRVVKGDAQGSRAPSAKNVVAICGGEESEDNDSGDSSDSGDQQMFSDEDEDEDEDDNDDDDGKKRGLTSVGGVEGSSMEHFYRPSRGEDIYGRKTEDRNVGGDSLAKYVPPARREMLSASGSGHEAQLPESSARVEHLQRLRRKVTGALNRLAEGTLEHCARDVLPLFSSSAVLQGANKLKQITAKSKKVTSSSTHAVAYAASDVTDAVTDGILSTCISDTQLLKGLVPAAAALVCALHTLLRSGGGSGEYGCGADLFAATFVERVASELQKVLQGETKGTWSSRALDSDRTQGESGDADMALTSRRGPNLVLLVAALYNLGLLQSQLVYGLVANLVRCIGDGKIDVEMLLFLLREIGTRLRSDDPAALQDIVNIVQETKSGSKVSTEQCSRVRFMEEELDALRKTKSSSQRSRARAGKPGGSSRGPLMDVDSLQRMRKLVHRLRVSPKAKASLKSSPSTGGNKLPSLYMSWDDLVHAETKGRWWRTGASWAGLAEQRKSGSDEAQDQIRESGGDRKHRDNKQNMGSQEQADASLDVVAARQRMNTDARRAVFRAIMGADSVDNACQRLEDLAHGAAGQNRKLLKGTQEREVVRVLMECCGQEASYNPFYAALMRRLCSINSEHRFTLQLAFWDEFKHWGGNGSSEIAADTSNKTSTRRAANLAKFLASLVISDALSLPSVIKSVDLSNSAMAPVALLFFRACFTSLLSSIPADPTSSTRGSESDMRVIKACARMGGSKESLMVRDQVAVFLSRHLKAAPAGSSLVEADAFSKKRRRFVKLLGDAPRLHAALATNKERNPSARRSGTTESDTDDEDTRGYM